MNQRIELHQERRFSEKLTVSFNFIKENFKGIFKPMLFVALPVALIGSYFMSEYFSLIFSNVNDPFGGLDFGQIMRLIISYVLYALAIGVGYLLLTCIVFAFISLYDEHKNDSVSVFTRVKERIWRFLGYNIVYGIIFTFAFLIITAIILGLPIYMMVQDASPSVIVFGILFLILMMFVFFVFCLLFGAFFYVLQCVLFFENQDFSGNISRTLKLLKRNWWSSAGYLLVSSFIISIAYSMFYMPMYVVMMANSFGIAMDPSASVNQVGLIITSLIGMVGTFLLYPMLQVFFSFQYYNLTEKLDGTGLLNQLGQLGAEADERDDESYL